MNTFDREDRMRRMMGGFTQEEQVVKKASAGSIVLIILIRFAVATAAVALIDVGLDGSYDLSLWGMVRVASGGLIIVALAATAFAETIAQRLSQ
jgi:predicted Na+-dependent transporter